MADLKLGILFIILIITGTSLDFILRQVLPDYGVIITISYLSLLVLAFYVFHSIKFQKISEIKNLQKGTLSPLTPIKNIVNTNDPLLIVRFFAAFLVFMTHIKILFHPNENLFSGIWVVLAGHAHAGMTIFFTLSGFLMGKAFLYERYEATKTGILLFYKSRWIRIFPLMFFVAMLLFVLQYPQVLRLEPFSLIRLFTFNYYGNTISLNGIGAMWSLSVEFQYYLIAPFIFLIFNEQINKNKLYGMSLILVVILLVTAIKITTHDYVTQNHLLDPGLSSLAGNLPFFLIGYLFNYIPLKSSENMARFITHDAIILLGVISAYFCITYFQKHTDIYFLIVSIFTGIFVSILDGVRNLSVTKNKSKFSIMNILQILGVLSYGFYLWHSGIAYIHSKLFPDGFASHTSYLMECFIIGMLVLFISLITYILVEDRFNSFKPNHKKTAPPEKNSRKIALSFEKETA